VAHESLTSPDPKTFDPPVYPATTLLYERRAGGDRRDTREAPSAGVYKPMPAIDRRDRKERRRRVDPTTFDKQYTPDELEFMTDMQRFKDQSGKQFPSHRDVLLVLIALGYRKAVEI
jgi:hypothetical protein